MFTRHDTPREGRRRHLSITLVVLLLAALGVLGATSGGGAADSSKRGVGQNANYSHGATSTGSAWVVQRAASHKHASLFDVHFVDLLHGWAFGDKILHTNDGGASWQAQPLPPLPDNKPFYLYDGTAADAHHAWVVGTTNDGHTAETAEVIFGTND